MTLQDIFDQLAYGELAQLFISEQADGTTGIKEQDYPRVFASVLLGLTSLHRRFLLRKSTLKIALVSGKASYFIKPDFAKSNTKSKELVKYIDDLDSPFTDNLLKIESIKKPDGTDIPLNVRNDPNSIVTPTYNSFVIPDTLTETYLIVNYRADHPTLDKNLAAAAPMVVAIELPPAYLEALLFFVASRIHRPTGLVAEVNQGVEYASRYEAACAELDALNLQIDDEGVIDHFTGNWA